MCMTIDVVFTKHEVPLDLREQNVVVFDILLATSTIVTLMEEGVQEIYPAVSEQEALEKHQALPNSQLIGEKDGRPIEPYFALPLPTVLIQSHLPAQVVMLTTNGTLAIRKSEGAKRVLIGSLLNNRAIVKAFLQEENWTLVCAGSHDQLAIEDVYGAGQWIAEYLKRRPTTRLTERAEVAFATYNQKSAQREERLRQSMTGRMLIKQGYEDDIAYVAKQHAIRVIPYYERGIIRRTIDEEGI